MDWFIVIFGFELDLLRPNEEKGEEMKVNHEIKHNSIGNCVCRFGINSPLNCLKPIDVWGGFDFWIVFLSHIDHICSLVHIRGHFFFRRLRSNDFICFYWIDHGRDFFLQLLIENLSSNFRIFLFLFLFLRRWQNIIKTNLFFDYNPISSLISTSWVRFDWCESK